ncbi:MAG: glycosyltransferase [Gemmatimonadales bacterium]
MGRLRVMQVTQDLGVGGLERVVATLCHTMDRSQFEPSVLCLRETGALAPALEADGVPITVLEQPRDGRPDYFAYRQVAAAIRARQIDVLHTHNTQALLDGVLASFAGRRPRQIHTDHGRAWPDRLRYRVFEHLASRRVHAMVGVSEATTANLRRYEWIHRGKLHTILNGIDPTPFDTPLDRDVKRRELGAEGRFPLLGVAARLTDQKGHRFLLESVARLKDQFPSLLLLICGEGELEGDLRATTEALGIQDHVRFAGVRLDLHDILRVLDLFVLSSVWEGLPMVLLEAMAARCPIVSTAVGGIAAAFQNGVTASLVAPSDPGALADAIAALSADAERRKAQADAARAVFEASYSAAAMTRRYERLYLGERR